MGLITREDNDPDFYWKVVINDETWRFLYIPKVNYNSICGSHHCRRQPRNSSGTDDDRNHFRLVRRRAPHLSEDATVNKEGCKTGLVRLREEIRLKRPEMWTDKVFALLHDKAPAADPREEWHYGVSFRPVKFRSRTSYCNRYSSVWQDCDAW
jgi:hypothetical protein